MSRVRSNDTLAEIPATMKANKRPNIYQPGVFLWQEVFNDAPKSESLSSI